MQNETARFRGIVVTHRGRIVFEAYPGMQENDSQVWMSTVKPVTSLLLEKLNEDGLVDYQDCIVNYFKEFEGTDWENVKLIDIVNMSTGMDLEETPETVSDPNTPVGRGFIAALPNRTDTSDRESLMDIMSEVKAVKEPGKAFEYSTFNTMILGFLIERVTGKNFADLFSEKIWSKAGMEGDGLMVVSPTGETLNGGIFSSRLRDLNRFGMLYTPSWNKVSNEQIVSDDYVRRIQEADTGDIFMKGHMGPWMVGELGERPSHNAYQWDGVFADGDMYKHGRNGQILYISPDKDVVVSIFASTLDFEFSYPAYARKIAMSLAVTD
jgi:CubicO group peptidase (beta-lactamase class C family)